MSWYVSLQKPGVGCPVEVAQVGHTSFLGAAIYHEAFGGEEFRDALNGLPASEAAELAASALSLIDESPDVFEALEPIDRNWPVENSVAFLRKLLEACQDASGEYPDATVYVGGGEEAAPVTENTGAVA